MPTHSRLASIGLSGGTQLRFRPFTTRYTLPDNDPEFMLTRNDDPAAWGVGRAGMRYRDLVPGRWGGRFIASHIMIADGGPVPDYVHFHKIRFQMIFVKSGWVRLVYEDQGAPFVMQAGDCVLQPPEIRHRVLECSPGLEVIEIGCPADHETVADHRTALPSTGFNPDRDFSGQRFVRHVAAGSTHQPWRAAGYEYRDSGIGDATGGLAGARVARPVDGEPTGAAWISHDTEFCSLTVVAGGVTFERDGAAAVELRDGDSVAVPGGTRYRLTEPTSDAELLDVTLPATFPVRSD